MSIYTVDESILGQAMMPPTKRTQLHVEWMKGLLSAMQRDNDLLNKYRDGFFSIGFYNSGTSYSRGSLVNGNFDFNQRIFESQSDSNIGNALLDSNFWVEVSPNFIGVNERDRYMCNKVVMEYALNRWFGTTFRQPGTDWIAPVTRSDIYIDTNGYTDDLFYVGVEETNSSFVSIDRSFGFINTTDLPNFFGTYQFTIFVPSAVYAALPGYTVSGSCDNIIRAFADKYAPYPLIYSISVY